LKLTHEPVVFDNFPRREQAILTAVDRNEIMRVLREFQAAGLEYVLIGAAALRERFNLKDEN
jgi:hypothetical protein